MAYGASFSVRGGCKPPPPPPPPGSATACMPDCPPTLQLAGSSPVAAPSPLPSRCPSWTPGCSIPDTIPSKDIPGDACRTDAPPNPCETPLTALDSTASEVDIIIIFMDAKPPASATSDTFPISCATSSK
jgi:hypothetical protein